MVVRQVEQIEDVDSQGADEHWVVEEGGERIGRCSTWWTNVPALPGEKLGVIGHYESSGGSRELLGQVCERLKARGCTMAVGPMDGNTWRRYRFATETFGEPAFLMEPMNPPEYPGQWMAAGFGALAAYSSAINDDLGRVDPRMAEVEQRVVEDGVVIRPIDLTRFEEELRKVHEVSLVSFRNNYLYTPMGEEEFLGQYRKVEKFVRPEMVLIAERAGKAIGFMFGVPDLMQAQRGETMDRFMLKTAAVLPERRSAGLGALLISKCQQAGRELGFKRSIFALMHDANASKSIAAHYARVMRRYTLFAKGLR